MRKIVCIGAGGHYLSCCDALSELGKSVHGYVDLVTKPNPFCNNYLGNDEWLATAEAGEFAYLITLGQIKSYVPRKRVYQTLEKNGCEILTLISQRSRTSPLSKIGCGCTVLNQAVIGPMTKIGNNCIINNSAIIEHGTKIGNHCHLATGAIVNGDVEIGDECFVGSGAVLRESLKITSGVVIGAGSVVISDILESGTWAGNPARKLS